VLDSGAEGLGFKSQPRRCRVTVLGKLFTPIVRLLPDVFAPTQSIDHSTSAADQSASVGAVYNVRVERTSEREKQVRVAMVSRPCVTIRTPPFIRPADDQ